MNESKISDVPYIVYESAQTRMDRINKRLVVALILALILIFASNMIWLHAWSQYDCVDEESNEITVKSTDGTANYIGNDGEINYGGDNSKNDKEKEPQTENPER